MDTMFGQYTADPPEPGHSAGGQRPEGCLARDRGLPFPHLEVGGPKKRRVPTASLILRPDTYIRLPIPAAATASALLKVGGAGGAMPRSIIPWPRCSCGSVGGSVGSR